MAFLTTLSGSQSRHEASSDCAMTGIPISLCRAYSMAHRTSRVFDVAPEFLTACVLLQNSFHPFDQPAADHRAKTPVVPIQFGHANPTMLMHTCDQRRLELPPNDN